MSFLAVPVKWLYNEFGVSSVYQTGRDAWLIILARACRMFAFGAISLIIALFFSSLEFTDFQIGLFMTMTLTGDVFLSFFLTLLADAIGRRRILLAGGVLMVVSGAVFIVSDNFWVLLLAAVFGVISATGGDFGPFRAIEESTLSQLTTPKTRSDVLSWYVTSSSLGSAIGTELSGRIVDALRHLTGWDITRVYHTMFGIYIIMGSVAMTCTYLLSDKCEAEEVAQEKEPETSEMLLEQQHAEESDGDSDSGRPGPGAGGHPPGAPRKKSRFAQISRETRWIMYKLWFLLTVDSLADGMVSYSLTNYYLVRKFDLAKSTLGDIMSASYFLTSLSTVFAGPLARRLGLINTMVFTHLPSSAAVLVFPAPRDLVLTVVLLYIRTGLNNMDQAPRAAFIAAVVRPGERTAVMGITSMLRTLASTAGPSFTGFLAGTDRFWIAFVVAGALRIAYDLGLFAMFVNMKLHVHEEADSEVDPRRESDEEEMTELGRVERAKMEDDDS